MNITAVGISRAAEASTLWARDVRATRTDDGDLSHVGLRLYEAPVRLLCTIDRNAPREQRMDHGCFLNNIIPAVNAFAMRAYIIVQFHGLETFIELLFAITSDGEIIFGIGGGYADRVGEPVTDRRRLEAFSKLHWQ